MYTPHFLGWGDGVNKYTPLFKDIKDNLKFDIYCKEIDLFNCKTIKNVKARSLAHKIVFWDSIFVVLPVAYSFVYR